MNRRLQNRPASLGFEHRLETPRTARAIAVNERGKPSSKVAFWALMAFTVVLLIGPQAYLRVLAPLRVALLTGGIALLAHVSNRLLQNQRLFGDGPEVKIVLYLLIWAVVTVPFSYWPGGSVEVLQEYMKTSAVFWLLTAVVDSGRRLRQVAWTLCLASVPLAASGIKQYIHGEFTPDGSRRILGYGASPLAANPNDLALVLNLTLPLAISLFSLTASTAARLLLIGIALLSAGGVVVTFSRAGFLSLVLIVILYFRTFLRRRPALGSVAILGILGATYLLPPGYGDRMASVRSVDADPTGSSQARWGAIIAGVRFAFNNPFVGAGIGMDFLAVGEELESFTLDDPYRFNQHSNIHNVYVQYAVDLALPGLAMFVLLMVKSFKNAICVREGTAGDPGSRELYHLAEGILVSLCAFALSAMFYPVAYHLYFYYFAGLAVATKATFLSERALRAPR